MGSNRDAAAKGYNLRAIAQKKVGFPSYSARLLKTGSLGSPDGSAGNRRRPVVSDLLDLATKLGILLSAVIAIMFALRYLGDIAIPVTLGLILGIALGPVAQKLEIRGCPPLISAFVVLGTLTAFLSLMVIGLSGPFEALIERMPELLTALERQLYLLRDVFFRMQQFSEATERVSDLATDRNMAQVVVKEPGFIAAAATSVPALAAQFLIFVVTLFFYLANRIRLRDATLTLCLTPRARFATARIFRSTERALSGYFRTISLINIGLGIATALMTWAFGFPTPYLWGAIAAVANFAPFIGPGVVAVILMGMGLVTFPELSAALLPALVFIGFNIIESQFITPVLLGKHLIINSLLIFLALVFWMWLWGPAGAFLAVPILISVIVVTRHLLKGSDIPAR